MFRPWTTRAAHTSTPHFRPKHELYSAAYLGIDCAPVGGWPGLLESGRKAFNRALLHYSQRKDIIMRRSFREPITMIVIIVCLLFVTLDAASQRKRQQPKLKPEDDTAAGIVEGPEDEILFHESYLLRLRRLPGWKVIDGTAEDSEKRQTVSYYDRSRIVRNRTSARAWVKYVEKQDGVEKSHSLALEEYDCSGHQ